MPMLTTLGGDSTWARIGAGPRALELLSDGMRAQVVQSGVNGVAPGEPEA